MANSLLTPTTITREALRVLHQKCNFIGSINRNYDDRYAKKGAKIGNTIAIREPNQFTVRSGASLSAQDVTEKSTDLTVATQKGVDISFDSEELTMHIDDFSARYIDPAMSALAATMENDAFSMYKDVYNFVDSEASALTFANVLSASGKLTDSLAPYGDRCFVMGSQGHIDLVSDTKGLFNDSAVLNKQFRQGRVGGPVGGFETYYENTITPNHTTGTTAEGATSGYLINNASDEAASAAEIAAGVQTITTDGGTTTFLDGDIITIANVFRVHPETKVSTGVLQQFVIKADTGATATSMTISPPMIASGARQNVDAVAVDDAAISKVGAGNAGAWSECIGFHKDAFAFGTVDLVLPEGVHFAAREVMDGISMRIIRDYTIADDKFPCRIDVMYGYAAIRPELAVRVGIN